ncbi:MAG: hypothetical protein RLZZ457_923, partial [Pseudomonadota bacterium]
MTLTDRSFREVSPQSAWMWIACVTAGLLQAMSMAWPFEGALKGTASGGLQLVSLAVLSWALIQNGNTKDAFTKGWLFSCAWLTGSTWWLYISLHTYGGLAPILSGLAVFMLNAGLAIIYSLASVVFQRVRTSQTGALSTAVAFAAAWTLAEIVRGTLWTGFPWGAMGYAHIDGVLQHWAPWFGVYGLSFIAALIGMGVAASIKLGRIKGLQSWIVLVLIVSGLGWTWFDAPSQSTRMPVQARPPLSVTLLQGNIPQDLKFGEGVGRALRDYRQALLASPSDVTVTPETALPLTPEQMPERYWVDIENHFSKGTHAAL